MWLPDAFFVAGRSIQSLRDRTLLFAGLTLLSDRFKIDVTEFQAIDLTNIANPNEFITSILAVVGSYYGLTFVSSYFAESLTFETQQLQVVVEDLIEEANSEHRSDGDVVKASNAMGRASIAARRMGWISQVANLWLPIVAFVYVLFFTAFSIDGLILLLVKG